MPNAGKGTPALGESLKCDKIGDFRFPFDFVYVLGDVINSGSFGTVYRTHHESHPDQEYAVKIVLRDCAEAEEEAIHEATIMRDLKNIPNIVQVIDFYMDDKQMYIVQDLAEGGDVFDRLGMRNMYTEQDAWELSKILLTTINEMHKRGIVHRDLKPENLLLKDNSDDAGILVCDFGLAKKVPEEGGLMTFCGTPACVAPEIVNGEPYDHRVDTWSIGVIMFLLLCGNYPFGNEDEIEELYERICDGDYDFDEEAWDYVSGSAKKVIRKLLVVDPEKRWTLEQALESTWFEREMASQRERADLRLTLVGIKKFIAKRKMKAAFQVLKLSRHINWLSTIKEDCKDDYREFASMNNLTADSEPDCGKTVHGFKKKCMKAGDDVRRVSAPPAAFDKSAVVSPESRDKRGVKTPPHKVPGGARNVNGVGGHKVQGVRKSRFPNKNKETSRSDQGATRKGSSTVETASKSSPTKRRSITLANNESRQNPSELNSSPNKDRGVSFSTSGVTLKSTMPYSATLKSITAPKSITPKAMPSKEPSKSKIVSPMEGGKKHRNSSIHNMKSIFEKKNSVSSFGGIKSNENRVSIVKPSITYSPTSPKPVVTKPSWRVSKIKPIQKDKNKKTTTDEKLSTRPESPSESTSVRDDTDFSYEVPSKKNAFDESNNSYFGDFEGSDRFEESESHSLDDLKHKKIQGIDYKNQEKYLTDEDFKLVFGGASRAEVATWKAWKKNYYKKQANIW